MVVEISMDNMINKLSLFFLTIYFGCSIGVFAQSDFVVTGSNQTSATGSVSLTVGQVSYSNEDSTSGSISGGVQQVYNIEIINGVEQNNINLNLTAYPNPTTENVWLRIDSEFDIPMSCVLIENSGKIVLESEISNIETEIIMRDLASGSYYLIVKEGQINIKIFKIQKSN